MEAEDVPTGCYKCGEPGHWSTDCPNQPGADTPGPDAGPGPGHDARGGGGPVFRPPPAPSHSRAEPRASAGAFPPSKSRPMASNAGDSGRHYASGHSAEEHRRGPPSQSQSPRGAEPPAAGDQAPGDGEDGAPGGPAEPERAAKAVSQRRRKLTPEMLLDATDGLPFLLGDMARQLLPCIKGGRGNELRDVRNLLEGYTRWQKRVFPSVTLLEFLERVEKLGTSRHLKVSLRDLLYRGSEDQEQQPAADRPQHQQSQNGDGGPGTGPGAADPLGPDQPEATGAWSEEAWGVGEHAEGDNSGPSVGGGSPVPGSGTAGHGRPGPPRPDGSFTGRPGFQVGGPEDDGDDADGHHWWDQQAEPEAARKGAANPESGAGKSAKGPRPRAEPAPTTGKGGNSEEDAAAGEPGDYTWGQGWGAPNASVEGASADDADNMMPAPGLRRRHRGPAAAAGPAVGAPSPDLVGASPSRGDRGVAGDGVGGQPIQQEIGGGTEEEGVGLEDVLQGDAAGSVEAEPGTAEGSQPAVKRRRVARMVLEADEEE